MNYLIAGGLETDVGGLVAAEVTSNIGCCEQMSTVGLQNHGGVEQPSSNEMHMLT